MKELVTIVTSLISLSLLWVLLFKLWPDMRLDCFRQSMFQLRDELFDYAASGNISFNDPAYRLLRKSMNGFIRYAHNLTFFRISITMMQWALLPVKPELKWTESWNTAVKNIPDEKVRADLLRFHQQSTSLVARRLVLGSPILSFLLVFVVCQYGVKRFADAVVSSLGKVVDPKLLEEEAARAAA